MPVTAKTTVKACRLSMDEFGTYETITYCIHWFIRAS